MVTLEKKPLETIIQDDEATLKFAEKTEKLLEYTVIKDIYNYEKENNKIIKIMREMDVAPFTIESVQKHQRYACTNKAASILLLCAAISLTTLGFFMIESGTNYLKNGTLTNTFYVLIALLCTILCLCAYCLTPAKRWQECQIKNYKKPIPDFVLQLAMNLKEKIPATEFTIEELRGFQPMLVAKCGGNRYYLEAWNPLPIRKNGSYNK